MTLDGQLALPKSQQRKKAKTGLHPKNRAPKCNACATLRTRCSTGIGTILADDSLLTDRSGLPRRKRLLRRDSRHPSCNLPPKVPASCKTADDDLLVFTAAPLNSPKARKLLKKGVELMRVREKARPHRPERGSSPNWASAKSYAPCSNPVPRLNGAGALRGLGAQINALLRSEICR